MLKYFLAPILFICLLISAAYSDPLKVTTNSDAFYARIVNIHDGDTITVKTTSGEQITVRLAGIDAPELDQPYGMEAKLWLDNWAKGPNREILSVSGRRALEESRGQYFIPTGRDRYGRTIAYMYAGADVVEGTPANYFKQSSINQNLVELGAAWWFRRYEPSNPEMEAAEVDARKHKRGLWNVNKKQPQPIPPWEWRKMKKDHALMPDELNEKI
ncbi:MAG: thermonuclease family protein [Candidatus Obscuribacterales bacterium]|nr:thermonuclease family protein [Candidatus Obscuribacterales bacterium]